MRFPHIVILILIFKSGRQGTIEGGEGDERKKERKRERDAPTNRIIVSHPCSAAMPTRGASTEKDMPTKKARRQSWKCERSQ
jgi:hypothetical protein